MIGDIFTLLLLNPLVNLLVLLSHVLWGSFGLAIIAFTILVRVTIPVLSGKLAFDRPYHPASEEPAAEVPSPR